MKKKMFFENVSKAIRKVQVMDDELSEMEYFMKLVTSLENELKIESREIDHFINNEAFEIELTKNKVTRKPKGNQKKNLG